MTYAAALLTLRRTLESNGIESARRQAEWIVEEVCRVGRARLIAHPEESVTPEQWEQCLHLAARRVRGEPIQYVLGYADFFGLRLRVTPDVLIPRPETEQLVELLVSCTESMPRPRVLDVGTGSGCIPLAYQTQRRSARTWGCDIHRNALRIAQSNRTRHELPVTLFQADALRPGFARAFAGVLDAIVSNPPYISESEKGSLPVEVREYEPPQALFVSGDALAFYRAITTEASAVLRPRGQLVFEVHEDRAAGVASILTDAGFVGVNIVRDFAGRERFVHGQLETRAFFKR